MVRLRSASRAERGAGVSRFTDILLDKVWTELASTLALITRFKSG